MFNCSFDLEAFKRDYLLKRSFFVRHAFSVDKTYLEGFYKNLLTPILTTTPTTCDSSIRVIKNGKTLSRTAWTQTLAQVEYLDPSAIMKAIDLGCSIAFDNYYRQCEMARAMVSFLESSLRCISSCNAYLSQKENFCFEPHRDTHHVLVFAVSGKKRWTVYNKKQNAFNAYHDHPFDFDVEELRDSEPEMHCLMSPGDMLYIPMGQVHSVENLEANSLHLTFQLNYPSLSTLMGQALSFLTSEENSDVLSDKSVEILNSVHPAYQLDGSLDKEILLKKLDDIYLCMKEAVIKECFIESQKIRGCNIDLKATVPASSASISDLLERC